MSPLLNLTAVPFNNQVLKQKLHYFTFLSITQATLFCTKLGKRTAPKLSDPQILDRLSSKMLTYSLPF